MTRALTVTINGQPVGVLEESDDLWAFEYSAEWAVSPSGFDLSPALSRAGQMHRDGASKRPVQWYFDNLLPEEAMRVVLAKEARLSSEDAFGMLGYFGAESAGALVLLDPERPASMKHGLQPLPLAELSRRIANLPNASLTKDAPKKMSLAGAQHKLLIVQRGEQLFEPLPATPSTHILKPNHPDGGYPASVMNEYFTMRLARAVGLPAPAVQRMYVPQPVFIVERFDRIRSEDATEVERRHVIDTCQLLNRARSFKYFGATLATLAEAVTLCRAKAAARMQLYRWLVFNLLVGNGDNHLKNVSFHVDASGIGIAPVYDLLCTAVYDTRAMAGGEAKWPASPLTVSLGGASTFDELRRSHVLEAGGILGLSKPTAERDLDRLLKTLPGEADALIGDIQAQRGQYLSASPDRKAVRSYMGGEARLLDAARHIVMADMVRRLG